MELCKLLVHNHERWLSKGRVLQRLWAFGKEILFFHGKSIKYEEKLRYFQLFWEMIKKGKLLDFWLT